MSGVMRPVGPESPETYWVRRALVVGSMLVLLIIVLVFLINLGGSPGQAAPPASTASPTSEPTQPTSPSTSGTSSSPSPGVTATSPSATTASATPTAGKKPSATASSATKSSPSAKSEPDKSPSTKPEPSKTASKTGSSKTGSTKNGSTKNGPTKAASSPAKKTTSNTSQQGKKSEHKSTSKSDAKTDAGSQGADTPEACRAKQVKAGIKSGGHQVQIGATVDFRLTMTNRSERTCVLDLGSSNYELKIYSGADRIWSTDDCARLVPDRKPVLQAGQTTDWKISWNGKRSLKGQTCKNRSEIPKAGYYYATSQLRGAKPVQYLLVLR